MLIRALITFCPIANKVKNRIQEVISTHPRFALYIKKQRKTLCNTFLITTAPTSYQSNEKIMDSPNRDPFHILAYLNRLRPGHFVSPAATGLEPDTDKSYLADMLPDDHSGYMSP